MSRSRREWWNTVAEAREWLCLGMAFGEVPFDAYVGALVDLERQFAREARTPSERLHLQRLTALNAVQAAFDQARPWKDFGPWLRRLQRLGFPNLWNRHHVACLYVQSLNNFPDRARDAFAMLADTEQRVLRLHKDRRSQQQMLDGIDHARREAASYGIQPPEELKR
ncbi:hypothetical protein [Hyalangium minutum]|uniref:Uncharacterized protein n=1 Tax=Hyalangium minutum TaxID=394096 RepID=A0A085WIB0_9BACT|nr:hypothetical protein [Hyalangium minutum]KFE67336.1 hypothetical protein DB31_8689 [Hyalangium minutum]KFE67423.1 hypothetical protein DB31_8776 [Hyalangium minutum]